MQSGCVLDKLQLSSGPDDAEDVFTDLKLHAVDPETGSWLLTEHTEHALQGMLIAVLHPGEPSVQGFKVSDEPAVPAPLGEEVPRDGTIPFRSKEDVRALLQENHLPVSDVPGTENLCVLDTLVLLPPYTAENCECANEIILGRVSELLSIVTS
eukprot:TRINITY_DN5339_c0_g1_i1.p1 TRINITY_DN5339_c0_g1~~TRINITY_DN5339_c0_g1_i1.p1  ORF type:complete len:154 (+),score=23.03 TRINITY_DN5339_c0_g1_i1:185-646(+)